MINLAVWKRTWALFNARERRNAWITLAFVVLGALSSALMVGSVLPFLTVLSDPEQIRRVSVLAWAYETFDFKNDYQFLVALGIACFTVIAASSAIQIAKTYVVARFAMMKIHSISYRLLIAYLRQPYTFFLDRHTGEMCTKILAEPEQLVMQFLRPAAEVVAAAFTILAVIGLLLWFDPLIAIVAIGALGGIFGVIFFFSRRVLKKYGYARVIANSDRFRIANEALGGIKDIKLLGRELSFSDEYAVSSRLMAQSIVGVLVFSQIPQYILQAVAFGGVILLCLFLMDTNDLAAGAALGGILPTLGVFAFAGQRLMPELSKLYQSLAVLQAGQAAVNVVYDDLMDKAKSGTLVRSVSETLGLKRCLEFDNVSYRYPNAEFAGLSGLSLKIEAGERIGIVGTTGAGKTTLADLVLGLLPPSEGQILVDGIAVTESNVRSWQQGVGYVPQDIFLTDGSISDNIAFGVPRQEIDEARVRRAAEIAQIDKFIRDDLPEGYGTAVGERGIRLSGGQRQRIGIARALYREADLVVFDEATSALDTLTEREAMAAIDVLPGDKTVIIIAHRLSTVEHCTRIAVLDNGRLVGFDRWDALMDENEYFQKLAKPLR